MKVHGMSKVPFPFSLLVTIIILIESDSFNYVLYVKGMSHERIIASGIYYYHTSDNIEGAGLQFRRIITESEKSEREGNGEYSIGAIREMGTAPTPSGHCLVFHNRCNFIQSTIPGFDSTFQFV
jgi:hypothetical protein